MKRFFALLTLVVSLYALGNLSLSPAPGGGSGSGDVVGPSSATSSRVASFSGTSGKIIAESDTVGIGAAGSADSKLYVSGGSLANTNNRGVFSDMTATTSATGSMAAYLARLNSPNSSFTTGIATLYDTASTIKGASHTITRLRNIGCTTPTAGTNNACLTDNTSWTGDYFIHQSGTRTSSFGGPITANDSITLADAKKIIFGNVSTKFINVDSGYDSNAMRFAMPSSGYFAWTINGTSEVFYLDNQDMNIDQSRSVRFTGSSVKFGYNGAGGAPAAPAEAYFKSIYVDTGANTTIGTATLVGGTVTVSTNKVATGDLIFCSRNATGGTPGHLRCDTADIVNGTSFVINSSSGSDTSTVNWHILKTY